MPTRNRRLFVPFAISYFLRQTYPNKELIVVDDGEDQVKDLIPESELIHFHKLNGFHSIGFKRNYAIDISKGDIIVHWDDDDWFASNRLFIQVSDLVRNSYEMNGLNNVKFIKLPDCEIWHYIYMRHDKPWLAGSSLCYKKSTWEFGPFEDLTYGEDTQFIWSKPNIRLSAIIDNSWLFAIIHPNNTIVKNTFCSNYKKGSLSECQRILGQDYYNYIKLYSSKICK